VILSDLKGDLICEKLKIGSKIHVIGLRICEIIDLQLNLFFEVNNIFYWEDNARFNRSKIRSNLYNDLKRIEAIYSPWSLILNLAYYYACMI
jgi:hypothetical protein